MTVLDAVATWVDICDLEDLERDRGACVMADGLQVALFRVGESELDEQDEVFAISNFDPFSQAHVLSRGILGSTGAVLKVTSPVYKHAFDLRTGLCFDDPAVSVAVFPVRIIGGRVTLGMR